MLGNLYDWLNLRPFCRKLIANFCELMMTYRHLRLFCRKLIAGIGVR